MSIRRSTVVLIVLSVLLAVVSAIGSSQPVEISFAFWGNQVTHDALSVLADRFMEANPDIRVELVNRTLNAHIERIILEHATGLSHDILMIPSKNMVLDGIIRPIDNYVAQVPELLAELNPATLADYQLYLREDGILENGVGSYYALPFNHFSVVMVYNPAMFAESGVTNPSIDWTYEDMEEVAAKLTFDRDGDGTPDVYGLDWLKSSNYISNNTTGSMVRAYGGVWPPVTLDPLDTTLDSPEVKYVLETQRRWIFEDQITPGYGSPAATNFVRDVINRVIGMRPDHNDGLLALMRNYPDADLEVAPMPTGPNGRFSFAFTMRLGITSQSQHPDEAWRFLSYLVGEEASIYLGSERVQMPSHRAGAQAFIENVPYSREVLLDALEHGWVEHEPITLSNSLTNLVRADSALTPIWRGEESVDSAVERVAATLRQQLREAVNR